MATMQPDPTKTDPPPPERDIGHGDCQECAESPATALHGWIQTYTGKAFYPLEPTRESIDILDIAHALSMICRYGGHTDRFYSVAEHCWIMSYAVPPGDALAALLHDAAEAYAGDMVRPLKYALDEYRAVEDRIEAVIAERYGLALPWPASVKKADHSILMDERRALLSDPPHPWSTDREPLGVVVRGYDPQTMKRMFIRRFWELIADRAVANTLAEIKAVPERRNAAAAEALIDHDPEGMERVTLSERDFDQMVSDLVRPAEVDEHMLRLAQKSKARSTDAAKAAAAREVDRG